ncbi:MAG: VOC family protein [Sphingomonadaceae bacterium]|nr:VOC family protein [Sphingomonadaceae bacterium]
MAAIVPPYHFTLVVEDVPAAMADLTRLLGLSWAPIQGDDLFTYSLQGPPYLELLKRRDDTIFDKTGLHHIGIWVDDMATESERLEQLGCEPELVRRDEEGRVLPGCFHKTRDGLRLELVQIGNSGPKLARMLNGGDYA